MEGACNGVRCWLSKPTASSVTALYVSQTLDRLNLYLYIESKKMFKVRFYAVIFIISLFALFFLLKHLNISKKDDKIMFANCILNALNHIKINVKYKFLLNRSMVLLELCHMHPYCLLSWHAGQVSLKKWLVNWEGDSIKLIAHPYLFHWPSLGPNA